MANIFLIYDGKFCYLITKSYASFRISTFAIWLEMFSHNNMKITTIAYRIFLLYKKKMVLIYNSLCLLGEIDRNYSTLWMKIVNGSTSTMLVYICYSKLQLAVGSLDLSQAEKISLLCDHVTF